ncbi:threonine aldolase [Patellaria atrata CBS 101060]|uniref:Threonine aldolase n=1 Tax=Patellaria atrata CBS 101060 TaxID=1346257 RepID=A0A9P4S3U2_9PEZI|nr:threonine aldolase [Patellaria atrata CBS 101060]
MVSYYFHYSKYISPLVKSFPRLKPLHHWTSRAPYQYQKSKTRLNYTPQYVRTMATNGSSNNGPPSPPVVDKEDVEKKANTLTPAGTKTNNWSKPGPAAFDFRSDVVTTPTPSMLSAIASTTLLDDVFAEDPTTTALETRIATLTGHPAALLVLSGTMGNQVALRTHLLAPPHAVLCDHRSHIVKHEAGGPASLSGAFVEAVRPRNRHHLTLEDVRKYAVLDEDVHSCPTRVISLENTLNGTVIPLSECRRIAHWAGEKGIRMHLDGARLWEAVASGAGELEEFCKCFDSVSLCFSKGLGAPIGSVVVGDEAFIRRARWVRKMLGGGMRQAGVVAAAARVGVEETFLGGRLRESHESARRVAGMWQGLGGRLRYPVETNMVWLDLEGVGVKEEEFMRLAGERGVRVLGGRLVVHYQISDAAIERLGGVMEMVLKGNGGGRG